MKKVIGYIELVIGVFFLFSTVSDIQLGFGLILIGDGFNKILK